MSEFSKSLSLESATPVCIERSVLLGNWVWRNPVLLHVSPGLSGIKTITYINTTQLGGWIPSIRLNQKLYILYIYISYRRPCLGEWTSTNPSEFPVSRPSASQSIRQRWSSEAFSSWVIPWPVGPTGVGLDPVIMASWEIHGNPQLHPNLNGGFQVWWLETNGGLPVDPGAWSPRWSSPHRKINQRPRQLTSFQKKPPKNKWMS